MTITEPLTPRRTAPELPGAGLDVGLFITCINDVMFPGTGIATTKLLERLGCRVHFPKEQTCCGQITTNTGYVDESVKMVRAFGKAFENFDYVVSPSGSCTAAVRDQHENVARHSGDQGLIEQAQHSAKVTYDVPEFLIDVLGVDDVGAYFPHSVTYHPSCHGARLLGLGDRPYLLLSKVRGMTLIDLPNKEQCCGFGGTFSVKNHLMSATMAADKARHVVETHAEYVVAGDNACLLNISGVLARQNAGVKPIHIAEILASTEE